MDVLTAIRTRRSHKLFTGQPVSRAVLEELLELATWAPNHHYTEPWKFSVVGPDRLTAMADAVDLNLGPAPAARKQADKIRGILAGAGAVIALRQVLTPTDPVREREDYAACCCAMQNIQLGAWALGLGSYWTTSPAMVGETLHPFWQLQPGEQLVGAIILGQPALQMPAVRHKPLSELAVWL